MHHQARRSFGCDASPGAPATSGGFCLPAGPLAARGLPSSVHVVRQAPWILAVGLTVRALAAQSGSTMDTTDRMATDAAMEAMAHHHDRSDPHLHMTAARLKTPHDSARYAALVQLIQSRLARYRDVRVAEREGFVQFLPNLPLPVYHFTKWTWAVEAAFTFNPEKPSALLYRKNPDGSFTWLGVMYTAPAGFSEDKVNARVPVSMAPWHQHVHWCVPKKRDQARWNEMKDGQPVFGPKGVITTRLECDAVDGRFIEHFGGWMVHIDTGR